MSLAEVNPCYGCILHKGYKIVCCEVQYSKEKTVILKTDVGHGSYFINGSPILFHPMQSRIQGPGRNLFKKKKRRAWKNLLIMALFFLINEIKGQQDG